MSVGMKCAKPPAIAKWVRITVIAPPITGIGWVGEVSYNKKTTVVRRKRGRQGCAAEGTVTAGVAATE